MATSLVWQIDNTAKIGATSVEVIGTPELIDVDGARSVRFNGKSDGLMLPIVPIVGWSEFTVEILFSPDSTGQHEQRFLHIEDDKGRRVLIELRLLPDGQWYLDTFLHVDKTRRLALIDSTKLHPSDRWYWASFTYADGRLTHFLNGVKEGEGLVSFEPMSPIGRTSLGVRQNKVSWFKGAIREVRFTPEALPASKLQVPKKD